MPRIHSNDIRKTAIVQALIRSVHEQTGRLCKKVTNVSETRTFFDGDVMAWNGNKYDNLGRFGIPKRAIYADDDGVYRMSEPD